MIDYQTICEKLLARLDTWVAQARWEKQHSMPLVDWEKAFLRLLALPELEEPRDRRLHEAMYMLEVARGALDAPDRDRHLAAFEQIGRFMEATSRESAEISTYREEYAIDDYVKIVGRAGRAKDLERYGALGKVGKVVELRGVQRDDYYVVELATGKRGLVHPAELEAAERAEAHS